MNPSAPAYYYIGDKSKVLGLGKGKGKGPTLQMAGQPVSKTNSTSSKQQSRRQQHSVQHQQQQQWWYNAAEPKPSGQGQWVKKKYQVMGYQ